MAGSFKKPLKHVSTWRKIAVGVWGPPANPTAQGVRELDLFKTLPWLEAQSEAHGTKLTITHLFVAALGRVLAKYPDYNVILRRNRPFRRDTVDIFVQVAVKGEGGASADLSGVKVRNADTAKVTEVAQQIAARAKTIRSGDDKEIEQAKSSLRVVPPALAPWIMRAVSYLNYDLGLNMTRAGLKPDPFGSAMVTNVAGFDIPHALVPLMPTSRVPFLFCLGKIHDRPRVVDGQVVVRPSLLLTGSFDHRVYDGYQIGQITSTVDEIVSNPERYDLI